MNQSLNRLDEFKARLDEDRSHTRVHSTVICVDNRSRVSGSENRFKVDFPRLTNIVSIDVIGAEVPNTLFSVNATNNLLDIIINATPFDAIAVPIGMYNATTLAAALQSEIDTAVSPPFPSGTVLVTADTRTNNMTFTITGGNTLDLLAASGISASNSIWATIGFNATDITGIAVNQIGQQTIQLKADENYIYLCIEGMGSIFSTDDEHDIFCKLVTDDLTKFKQVYSIAKTYSSRSPLPSMQSANIALKRRDGSLYQLRGSPMSFSLEIMYMN